jgi:uncharacterized membrane protein
MATRNLSAHWRVESVRSHLHTSIMKTAFLILGILALLAGLLWIGQGTGTINWPQSSFMIKQIQWAYYGAALAIVGLILIWRAKR